MALPGSQSHAKNDICGRSFGTKQPRPPQIVNSSEFVSLPKAKPLMVATASFSDISGHCAGIAHRAGAERGNLNNSRGIGPAEL